MNRRSLQNISIDQQLESAKLRVSSLLKKRKKVSTLIKSFEIDKLSQMLKLEVMPSQFEISGEKLDRSKTEPKNRFPKLRIQTQRKIINEEEEDLPSIATPKPEISKNLSKTLKRVLRSSRPCQHSISSYYPVVNVPDHFSMICNIHKKKGKRKGYRQFMEKDGEQKHVEPENRSKKPSIKPIHLTQSSPLMRSKSITLQYQEMKRYFQQKYYKQK